jgi:hypothetical protein
VSSLGSNAAGADEAAASAGGSGKLHNVTPPVMPHPDSGEHWYYMQQQQQQKQQQQPNYNVNYNAILGREVAQFLHGEHVAKAAERNQQLQRQRQRQEQTSQQRNSYYPYGPPAPPHGWNAPHHNTPPEWARPQQQQQYGWYTGSHEHLNQHIRIFTPPSDVAHYHLLHHEPYLPSGSEDEGDDHLIGNNKTAAGGRNGVSGNIGSQQQQRQIQWNQHGSLPPSASSRGQNDPRQFPSNQLPHYQHIQQQGGDVHWNDRSSRDAAIQRQQQKYGAHVDELPSEKSSLLRGGGNYDEYELDNNLGTGRRWGMMMPQHHGMPPQNPLHSKGAPPSSSSKKKKSKRRRHQKARKWECLGFEKSLHQIFISPLTFLHFYAGSPANSSLRIFRGRREVRQQTWWWEPPQRQTSGYQTKEEEQIVVVVTHTTSEATFLPGRQG